MESSHAYVEPQIKSLEQDVVRALAVLRRRINAYNSPIYRLYPEILSRVASHLPRNSLVDATHVSYNWRTTLISSPRLWTDISFICQKEAFAFLERSKSTPISVFMDIPQYISHATAIDFLNHHAARIEILIITSIRYPVRLLLPPMPNLKRLDLCWERIHSLSTEINGRTDRLIFPTLTTFIVWGSDAFPFSAPRLTKLQVRSVSELAMDKLLSLLKRCPLLEELVVDYRAGITPRRILDTVRLPRLRFYSHFTSINVHLDLFNKLSFPPSCSVVFNYWNGSRNAREADDVLRFHNPSPLADLKRIRLKTDDGGATVELIDARNRRVYLVASVNPGGKDLDLGDHCVIHRSYASYLESLNTRTVDILCVEGPSIGMLSHAEQVLSCVGGIKTLILSGSVVTSYLLALSPKPAHRLGKDVGASRWRCPALNTLVVHSHDLLDDFEQDVLCHVSAVAQKRKKGGIPFRSVSLFIRSPWDEKGRGPMESYRTLELLRGYVEELEVMMGDDLLDWNADGYFFAGIDVRRDRYCFSGPRDVDEF